MTFLVLALSVLQGPAVANAQTDMIPLTGECFPPCVEVTCEGPPQACDGETVYLQVTAYNCSEGLQNITLQVTGPGGFVNQFDFFGVEPGVSITQEFDAIQRCDGGGASVFTVTAISTNDCGDTATAQSDCFVECNLPPCVEVSCETPQQACSGESIVITGTAYNCSNGLEDIQVRFIGPGGVLGSEDFYDVVPGSIVAFEQIAVQECQPGTAAEYRVEVVAQNQCGQAFAETSCFVECGPPPCVEVVCETPPEACPGEEFILQAFANNCGENTEDIELTIYGPAGVLGSQLFAGVPPGGAVAVDQSIIQECAPGTAAEYTVEARATNGCGEAFADARCIVECGAGPCVTVACDVPAQACPGEKILLTAVATNCGGREADITLTISGPSGFIGAQLFAGVPPGTNVAFQQEVVQECEAGTLAKYAVVAQASNDCGEAFADAQCAVECAPGPCVEVRCEAPQMALDGEPVEILAVAANCSEGAEDINVSILGPGGVLICENFFPGVAPGAAVEFSCTDIIECDESAMVVYTVLVVATNDCGAATAACETVVNCEPPVPTRIKLFEADSDENGIRLELEVQDVTAALSAVVHRGVSEDLRYALPITPQPIPFTGSVLEYVDETVDPGTKYWYWIEIREDGSTAAYAGPIVVVAPKPGVSVTFLAPAQPNPTSTSAVFRYSIGSDVAGQGEVNVSLAIYDSRGRLVRMLVSGRQSVGEYSASWDGRGERGGRVPAGVYYYRFRAGAHSEHSSLVITR